MLLIEYQINDELAQAYFDYAGYHVRRMTPLMHDIANLVHGYVEAQFDTEGYAMSGGWEELNPRYVEDERGGQFHPILDREGILREDVTKPPRRGAEFGSGLHYGNGWVTFRPESLRNGVDLVEVHSQGRAGGSGPHDSYMPARSIWETPADLDFEVNSQAFLWLRELKRANIRRAGRALDRPDDLTPSFSFEAL